MQKIERAVFVTDRLSHRSFLHALRSRTSCLLVAQAAAAAQGYALVNFRKGARAARLFSLACAPDAPKGCGRALLAAAETEVFARGVFALRLEAHFGNARAIDLYERAGYRRIGRHENYYEDGSPALRFEKTWDAAGPGASS